MSEIKIGLNPGAPGFEVYENKFTMQISPPYTKSKLTLKIDFNITKYIENDDKEGVLVRQFLESKDESHTIKLNFSDEIRSHDLNIDNQSYKITFLEGGEEDVKEFDGQKFPYFIFSVEKK